MLPNPSQHRFTCEGPLPEDFSREPVNGVKPFPFPLGWWAYFTLKEANELYYLCSSLGSWKNAWEHYVVECDCEGDRIVCKPKSEAEKALEIRHFPDCIAGCWCEKKKGAGVVDVA